MVLLSVRSGNLFPDYSTFGRLCRAPVTCERALEGAPRCRVGILELDHGVSFLYANSFDYQSITRFKMIVADWLAVSGGIVLGKMTR